MIWWRKAVRNSRSTETVGAFCLILCLIMTPLAPQTLYLVIVTILADLIRFVACGAWYYADSHRTALKHCPQTDKVYGYGQYTKICLSVLSFLLILFKANPILILFLWIAISAISIIEMVRTTEHVLHKWNRSWLRRFDGKITFLDKLSIIRLAVAIILPCITLQSGKWGLIVTMIVIVAYAICAEIFELIYSKYHSGVNRAYCWVDTIARKTLFIVESVALALLVVRHGYSMNTLPVVIPLATLMAITLAKDVITAYWHLSGRYSFSDGKSAASYEVDILRNVVFYGWIIISCIALLVDKNAGGKVILLFAFILSITSLVSLMLDDHSIKTYYMREPY